MLSRVSSNSYQYDHYTVNKIIKCYIRYDSFFGMLIIANLCVLGLEVDHADHTLLGPANPYWFEKIEYFQVDRNRVPRCFHSGAMASNKIPPV